MKRYFSISALLASAIVLAAGCSLTGDFDESVREEITEPVGELTIEVDEPLISADGVSPSRITVKQGGIPVTEGVTLYDASTNKVVDLPGMVFTTDKPGSYSFWASYQTRYTDPVSIMAISAAIPVLPEDPQPENLSFSRKVLVTQFTGTGCGYCPYMINLLRTFSGKEANKGKFVLAAYHSYNQSDPAYISSGVNRAMGISGYPSVALDLKSSTKYTNYNSIEGFEKIFATEYASSGAKAAISVSTVLDAPQVVVKARIKASEEGEYRIAAWLLEDGISAKQSNYGASGEFDVHDNCVRMVMGRNTTTDFTGTKVNLKAGEEAEQYFLMELKSGWVGENCHAIVFVSTTSDGRAFTVNNVTDCPMNATVQYSYE